MTPTGTLAPNTPLAPAQKLPQGPTAGAGNQTAVGGQSAVNPQATGNAFAGVDKYIDQSYNNAMNRLQPQIDQGRDALTQSMVDRGIGVGSEAYGEAMRTQAQGENDAMQNAAFQAMGFGTNLQNQMFGQDAQRSQLANSLVQAQMQNRLGYSNLSEQGRQFNSSLGEQQRQYNDRSSQAWDDKAFRDLNWMDGTNFRDRSYNDQQDMQWFNMRQALLGAIPGWNPAQIDVNGAAGAATGSQQAAYQAQNEQNQQAFQNMTALAGAASGFVPSDPALKDGVQKIGEVNGHNWYRWEWNDTAGDVFGLYGESQGVMADEVPEDMRGESDGFMTVDYARVVA